MQKLPEAHSFLLFFKVVWQLRKKALFTLYGKVNRRANIFWVVKPSCCLNSHKKLCNSKIFKVLTKPSFLDLKTSSWLPFFKCDRCERSYKKSRPHFPDISTIKEVHNCERGSWFHDFFRVYYSLRLFCRKYLLLVLRIHNGGKFFSFFAIIENSVEIIGNFKHSRELLKTINVNYSLRNYFSLLIFQN